ncbi:hypothetical protein HY212_05290 [Candidatus Pacearchaeota archaeon]|nr:hypothetical protein [Candidatus Pacearchaeota archaeon]
MDIYNLVVTNKEIFKLIYALLIVAICIAIVLKTHKLFRLSSHNGIRYFRNAFFFFGLGFASRYFLKFIFQIDSLTYYAHLPIFIFEFFIVMAGFFLLYSLIWRKLDSQGIRSESSLFNLGILVFYVFAAIIVVLDHAWSTLSFMFFSQIITFFIASIISYKNTLNGRAKGHTQKLYFSAMVIALCAWILNTLLFSYFNFNIYVMVNVYVLNMIFFLLFLFGVFRAVRS